MNLGLRLGMAPRLRLALGCELCKRTLDEDQVFKTQEQQLRAIRPGNQPSVYQPCLQCGGMMTEQALTNAYRKRVDALVKSLRVLEALKAQQIEATKNWSPDIESLVGNFWDGHCPIDGCAMAANASDHWECVSLTCRLQIRTSEIVIILKEKGVAEFRVTHDGRLAYPEDEDHMVAGIIREDHRLPQLSNE